MLDDTPRVEAKFQAFIKPQQHSTFNIPRALPTRRKVLVQLILPNVSQRERSLGSGLAGNNNPEEDGIRPWEFDESQWGTPPPVYCSASSAGGLKTV